jgi:hypothetical protein
MCDLELRGALYPSTPTQAAAEREAITRRVHALLDDLASLIDPDRATTLDNAVSELIGAIELEVSARLVEVLVAVNHADVSVFAAPVAHRGRAS